MDIIKQILKDYVEGRISRTNAEYQASMQLGGNWAIEVVNSELTLTKFDYEVVSQDDSYTSAFELEA